MLSSQTGAIFRKEPAGYVKIFVFMLLGYLPVLLLDFRQIPQLRADLLHFIRQMAVCATENPASSSMARTAGLLVSCRSPLLPMSLTVITAAVYFIMNPPDFCSPRQRRS